MAPFGSAEAPRRVGRVLRRLRWVWDAWLITGITLAVFLALELLYRGQAAMRSGLRGDEASAGEPLEQLPPGAERLEEWNEEMERVQAGYDPYRGSWLLPSRSPSITVDSAGLRRTVHPQGELGRSRRLFLLGGSAMWGFYAPDSLTIPSLVAAGLVARGLADVEVVNLAQPGLNATQELITLLLELRRGNVPHAVVFFDGFNDVVAAGQARQAGHVNGESRLSQRWVLGGRGFWKELAGLGRHSRMIQHLHWRLSESRTSRLRRRSAETWPPITGTWPEALGGEFGFPVFFVWQPLLATTRKPLTPVELSLRDQLYTPVPAWPETREMLRLCTAAVDSILQDGVVQTYVPLHGIFDGDPGTMFVDDWAHLTEAGDRRVADRIVDLVAPALEAGR